MKLKKFDYVMLAIIVVGVVLTLLLINNGNIKEENGNSSEKNNIYLLSDYSRFFTIESSLYKFVGYLQSKDTSSLIKVVDGDFINVLEIFS